MEKGNVLYAKNEGYHFQEVFFNGHPVNKKNPNPPPPRKPKKADPPPPPPPENQPDNKQPPPMRHRKKKKHGFFKFTLILILLIVLALVGGSLILISRIEYVRDTPDHEAVAKAVGELKTDDQVQNIIIFGVDNHAESENGRSDTMLLLSVDRKHHLIKQTSFLRDMYLPVFEQDEDKLNAAFAKGGAKLAIETIEYNFKIKIDYYVIVGFESFVSIVNDIGGIDIELTSEEVDYIDWQSHKNKQVETRNELDHKKYEYKENPEKDDNDKYVKTASVHLNGRQALWHARNRGEDGICKGDDFYRTKRQREVISAIIDKVKSSNPVDLIKTIYDVAPMITTNMNFGNTLKNCFGMLVYLKYDRLEHKVPQTFNFGYDNVNGESIIRVTNLEEEKNALHEFIFNKEKK